MKNIYCTVISLYYSYFDTIHCSSVHLRCSQWNESLLGLFLSLKLNAKKPFKYYNKRILQKKILQPDHWDITHTSYSTTCLCWVSVLPTGRECCENTPQDNYRSPYNQVFRVLLSPFFCLALKLLLFLNPLAPLASLALSYLSVQDVQDQAP